MLLFAKGENSLEHNITSHLCNAYLRIYTYTFARIAAKRWLLGFSLLFERRDLKLVTANINFEFYI